MFQIQVPMVSWSQETFPACPLVVLENKVVKVHHNRTACSNEAHTRPRHLLSAPAQAVRQQRLIRLQRQAAIKCSTRWAPPQAARSSCL